MSWKSGSSHPRRPASLAARLTAWYTASAFGLVVLATGVLYWTLVAKLDVRDAQLLADKIHILTGYFRQSPGDVVELRQEIEQEWADTRYSKIYIRIFDPAGGLMIQTPRMAEILPASLFAEVVRSDDVERAWTDVRLPDGQLFRTITTRADIGSAEHATAIMQIALDRSASVALLAEYRRTSWVVLGLALVACAVVGDRLARRGLGPVEEIVATAKRVRSSALHERLQTAGLPAELLSLAETFNGMLDRLQESFVRLGQFSVAIAHELRTPVNNLRGEAEVALGKARSADDYREVLGSCLEECDRLTRIIESLLFLARTEDPEGEIVRESIDVARELRNVAEFYEAVAVRAQVTFDVEAHADLRAGLDRTLFQRAVSNLVANALDHTPPEGNVTLRAQRDGAAIHVEVCDTGRGIPEADLPHVFDRFFRKDPSRPGTLGGTGLGLAIVKSIVTLHGGTVEIDSEVGRGTRVTMVFPTQSEMAR